MMLKAEEFFDLSNDLFCIGGTDGFFKKVNKALCNALGYTSEEMLSKPIFSFIHPDDVERSYNIITNPPVIGGVFENRYRCKNGEYKWFAWSRTVIPDQKLMYASARDITKEKQLEKDLLKLLNENQLLLDSSLDVICSYDKNGNYLSVSKASEFLWGYKPEELVGKHFMDFVCKDDVSLTQIMRNEILAGINVTNFENRFIRKDGSTAWIVWSAKWSENDQTMFCVARDATQKKIQEEQITFNERRFRSLIQSGSDLIAILDEGGVYQYLSPAIAQLGYSPDFLILKSPFDFIHPDDLPKVKQTFNLVLHDTNQVIIPLFRFKHAGGEWHWIETIATNRLSDPAIKGIVINSRDITERIKAETDRQRATQRTYNLIDNFTDGYILLNKNWEVIHCNSKAAEILHTTQDQLKSKCVWDIYPDAKKRAFYDNYKKALDNNTSVSFEEYLDSLNQWFEVTAYPYQEDLTVFFKDITESKVQQLTLKLEKDVLEMNTNSVYLLKHVVDHYLEGLYQVYPTMQCAVQMVKDNLLLPFSAPSLFKEFNELFKDGISITKTCSDNASYYKNNFVICDISQHPDIAFYKDVFTQKGILSFWSIPIINDKNQIIANLVIFYNEVKEPSEKEKELLKRVSTFIKIIIDSHITKDNLEFSSERYRLVTLASKDAIYDWDVLHNELYWGESFEKLLGYKETVTTLEWWADRIHPEDIEEINISLDLCLNNAEKKYWHAEYRFLKADHRYAYIIEDGFILRDKAGKAVRMVGAMQDHTKIYEHQYQVLKQNNALRDIATINSHYIRKPLANILGLISTIKTADSSEVQELINLLEASGCELDEITRDIAKRTYS